LTCDIKKENQREYEMSENYGPQYEWLIHKKTFPLWSKINIMNNKSFDVQILNREHVGTLLYMTINKNFIFSNTFTKVQHLFYTKYIWIKSTTKIEIHMDKIYY
jgi:hypothetical protein